MSMKFRIYRSVVNRLPASLAGRCDYFSGHHSLFNPWGGPMNGQTARMEIVRGIVSLFRPRLIVETGSFRGATTEWLAGFGIPVLSIETNARFFEFTRRRLASRKNVDVRKGNSVDVLRLTKFDDPGSVTVFYLDSHWGEHLPLRDELELIFDRSKSAVVIVDDFKVVGDDGYGFDDYGPDKALTVEYVKASRLPDLTFFFPGLPAAEETGGKRGCAVLTADPSIAEKLEQLPLLRRHAF